MRDLTPIPRPPAGQTVDPGDDRDGGSESLIEQREEVRLVAVEDTVSRRARAELVQRSVEMGVEHCGVDVTRTAHGDVLRRRSAVARTASRTCAAASDGVDAGPIDRSARSVDALPPHVRNVFAVKPVRVTSRM